MTHLLRIDLQGDIQKLEPALFANEVDDLQGYIAKNPAILGDNITIIAQQLDTGSGKRLDMLALENVREDQVRPVVIELKNAEANTDALLQVLKYADWVLSNTDSVRLHAGKANAKFKDLDNTSVKVAIVAPAIKKELLELSNYFSKNIDFEFIQFERFRDDAGDLLVLDRQIPVASPISIATAQEEWNWERFEKELKISSDRITIGKHLYNELVRLTVEKEWELSPVFRKYYIPFKKSGYNIVEIDLYVRPCYLSIQLPKPLTELGLPEIYPELEQSYNGNYHRYSFRITDTNIDIAVFSVYIEKALEMLNL